MRNLILVFVILLFASVAHAQETCRAADITGDGQVSAPNFSALSVCYGQPVDVPLPSGQYVGYAPPAPDDWRYSISIPARNLRCRENFGPEAHWCTTLEYSKMPDPKVLPPSYVVFRATPPVNGGTDWVTGEDMRNVSLFYLYSLGLKLISHVSYIAEGVAFAGTACCMEVQP